MRGSSMRAYSLLRVLLCFLTAPISRRGLRHTHQRGHFRQQVSVSVTPRLLTNIVDFGGFDSSIIKGWNYRVHRGFPGKFESSNLSSVQC